MFIALVCSLVFVGFVLLLAVQIRFFSVHLMWRGAQQLDPDVSQADILGVYTDIIAGDLTSTRVHALLGKDFMPTILYLTWARKLTKLSLLSFAILLTGLLFTTKGN